MQIDLDDFKRRYEAFRDNIYADPSLKEHWEWQWSSHVHEVDQSNQIERDEITEEITDGSWLALEANLTSTNGIAVTLYRYIHVYWGFDDFILRGFIEGEISNEALRQELFTYFGIRKWPTTNCGGFWEYEIEPEQVKDLMMVMGFADVRLLCNHIEGLIPFDETSSDRAQEFHQRLFSMGVLPVLNSREAERRSYSFEEGLQELLYDFYGYEFCKETGLDDFEDEWDNYEFI
jgi:hypothetical protein